MYLEVVKVKRVQRYSNITYRKQLLLLWLLEEQKGRDEATRLLEPQRAALLLLYYCYYCTIVTIPQLSCS